MASPLATTASNQPPVEAKLDSLLLALKRITGLRERTVRAIDALKSSQEIATPGGTDAGPNKKILELESRLAQLWAEEQTLRFQARLLSSHVQAHESNQSFSFSLSHTPVSQNEAIETFQSQRSMVLSGHGLTALPESLFSFSSIVSLDLSSNQLDTLPEQLFFSLSFLEILDVSNNKLTTISGAISNLVNLRHLFLHGNAIAGAEDASWLTGLDRLETLRLSGNRLTADAVSSWALRPSLPLKTLDLARNPLESIPVCLGKLAQLARLYLDSCSLNDAAIRAYFVDTPAPLGQALDGLKVLSLNDNGLSTLPKEVFRLYPSLRVLSLADNRFTSVPFVGASVAVLRLDSNPVRP
ncbi:hypothetical protein H696_02661 [Fonticula alba]|uniref:L domain-like protein n=1 Tax=Fonticula alba TaxID=691883 RepID=A0A058Z7R3_FONAL|nr:hypothetical protein H696_02661 [Fonticula alba]KCV70334.1 hypothetical protein H696_02661 [Fonticula alba]|eukprot:XP_009494850.1 hypothetical protein H696_02661 [Fonticula alba]